MTFKKAVNKINNTDLKCFSGLRAMKGDAKYVKVSDSSKLGGSINIDKSLENCYPNQNRWDYSFGYRDFAYFVEIHPAYTSEVNTVLKKLKWLKEWLSQEGKPLYDIKANSRCFTWIYTSKFDILKNSKQYRAAVQNGIIPIKELILE